MSYMMIWSQHNLNIRVYLAGLLSGSSRGALPNVFLEEPFFRKK